MNNKLFLILGMGKSGQATQKFLTEQGAKIITWDDQVEKRSINSIQDIPWDKLSAVIQSPGISFSFPNPHPVTALAKKYNVPIQTDLNLLQTIYPHMGDSSVDTNHYIGITGTNGKSTTTALIGHILQNCGYKAEVGGNIGIPALSLNHSGEEEYFVLELSSFQLEISKALDLYVAIWLNVSPDHLDRHGTIQDYILAKERILINAKQAIICIDEPSLLAIFNHYKQKMPCYSISTHQVTADYTVNSGFLTYKKQRIFAIDSFSNLRGEHNWQNIIAAYACCQLLGCDMNEVVKAIYSFPGLAHRQQKVCEIGNVTFINDSKATNSDAAAKALSTFASDNIFWILGGKPKSDGIMVLQSFFPLIRHAFLIGEAARDFADVLYKETPLSICHDLQTAVNMAYNLATKYNDKAVVLFSPACASFDQFKNFEHRGEVFIQMVKNLQSLYDIG